MKINDMYFGKTDAYNEFLEYGADSFKEIFFDVYNIDVNKMLNGGIYYILGKKGTGKTMLLKYIEAKVNEEPETRFSKFIRFNSSLQL